MRASSFLAVALFALCLIYAGCEKSDNKSDTQKETSTTERVKENISETADKAGKGAEEAVEDVAEKSKEMHETQVEELNKKAPAEIATELWNQMQTEEYKHWKEIPAAQSLNKGSEKKKQYIKTYINDLANNAIESHAKSLPPGSIVVKERYDDQDQLQIISAMINLGGNDPQDINWFWAQYSPDGKALKMGETGKGVKSLPR